MPDFKRARRAHKQLLNSSYFPLEGCFKKEERKIFKKIEKKPLRDTETQENLVKFYLKFF